MPAQKSRRYHQILLERMKSHQNPTGRDVSIRQLAAAIGKSYEQCRLVLRGHPVQSREFNDSVCSFLGLEPEAMWKLALLEKARERFGEATALRLDRETPLEERLHRVWRLLSPAKREQVVRFAETLQKRTGAMKDDTVVVF